MDMKRSLGVFAIYCTVLDSTSIMRRGVLSMSPALGDLDKRSLAAWV